MTIERMNHIWGNWSLKSALCVGGFLAVLNGCEETPSRMTVSNSSLFDESGPGGHCSDRPTQTTNGSCDWNTTPIEGGSTQLKALTVYDQLHVALQIQGEVDLGGKKLLAKESSGVVAKLTSKGEYIWSRVCNNVDSLPSIAADENDNVVFIASPKNDAALTDCLNQLKSFTIAAPPSNTYVQEGLGGIPETAIGTTDPAPKVEPPYPVGDVTHPAHRLSLVVKLDANGLYRWHQVFNGTEILAKFDGQQNLIVSGYENGVSEECTGDECVVNHDGTIDGSWFISKFSANGSRLWTKRFPWQNGGSKPIDGLLHTVAHSGEIFIAGSYESFTDILNHPVESVGDRDVFVARLMPESGDIAEMSQLVGKNDMSVTSIAIAGDGLPIIVGSFMGTLEFKDNPPGDKLIMSKGDYSNVYMAKPLTKGSSHVALERIGIESARIPSLIPLDLNPPRVYLCESDILVSGVSDEPAEGCPLMPTSALQHYRPSWERDTNVHMPVVNGPSPLNIATTADGRIFFGGNISLECNAEATTEVLQVGYKYTKIIQNDD